MALTPEEALARYENNRVDSELLRPPVTRKVHTGLIPDPKVAFAGVNKAWWKGLSGPVSA